MVNLFNKAGKSLYFADRKEYYRRVHISEGLIKFHAEKREEEEREVEEINTEYTYNVKLIYDDKGKHGKHDYKAEIKVKVTSKEEPTRQEIEELLASNLPDDYMDTIFANGGFFDFDIGEVKKESTSKDVGFDIKVTKFSSSLD